MTVTNPTDKKKIKDALFEISGSYTRIEAERELVKDIVNDIAEKYQLPKKAVTKMARAYHKQSFTKEVVENEEFQELYETILGSDE